MRYRGDTAVSTKSSSSSSLSLAVAPTPHSTPCKSKSSATITRNTTTAIDDQEAAAVFISSSSSPGTRIPCLSTDVEHDNKSNNNNRGRKRRLRRRHRNPYALIFTTKRNSYLLGIAMLFIIVGSLWFFPSKSTNRANMGPPPNPSLVDENNNNNNNSAGLHRFPRTTNTAPDCSSSPPLSQEDVSYTLVTQCSLDRLWMMKAHCFRWGSEYPISIAVYTNETQQHVQNILVQDCQCNPEQLTVQILSTSTYPPTEYPVNVLRNMALSKIQTSHLFYTDIDFWLSADLQNVLGLPQIKQALSEDAYKAVVIPAFQIYRQCHGNELITEDDEVVQQCETENIQRMPETLRDMIVLMKERQLTPFDPTNRGGHFSTRYAEWPQQQAGELLDLPCIESNRYEPYLVLRYCQHLPPFVEEFTGYGKNKMTWIMHLRRLGYQFTQLGIGFVCHYPHLDSPSRLEWNEKPKNASPMELQQELIKQRKKQLRKQQSKKDNTQNHDGTNDHHDDQDTNKHKINWEQSKRGRVDKLFVEYRHWLYTHVPDHARTLMCEDRKEDDDWRLYIDRE